MRYDRNDPAAKANDEILDVLILAERAAWAAATRDPAASAQLLTYVPPGVAVLPLVQAWNEAAAAQRARRAELGLC